MDYTELQCEVCGVLFIGRTPVGRSNDGETTEDGGSIICATCCKKEELPEITDDNIPESIYEELTGGGDDGQKA